MKKSNKFINWFNQHRHFLFWTRFVLWCIFACVLPFLFIAYRFDLFKTVSKISVSGWGIFALIIIFIFAFALMKYIKIGFKGKFSFSVQCLGGFFKIIVPLLCMYLFINSVKENINYFLQVLGCVIICETIAIPINPMPKWAYEKQKEVRAEDRKDTLEYIFSSVTEKKKEEK